MLELKNIRVSIEEKEILSNINAEAVNGELTLLLGANGTGKTTLFNAVAGLLPLQQGELFLAGSLLKPESRAADECITYIRDDGGTIPLLTIAEQLRLQAGLHNIKASAVESRIKELVSLLDLSDYINYRAEELSAGVRKKLGIAIGLIKDSEIFLFDEPFSTLDYNAASVFINMLRILKQRNRIIILSTHSPQILADSADRLWLLENNGLTTETDSLKIKERLNLNGGFRSADNTDNLAWIELK